MRLANTTVCDEERLLHRRRHTGLNHALLAVLRSPLHRLLDDNVCEVAYQAPRSGRHVALPVMYAADGDDLVILVGDAAAKTWWRAFRKPHGVQVRRHGATRAGTARVISVGDARYAGAATAYECQHGLRPAADDQMVLIENLTPLEGDT
ncbi:MAG TPA: hypothetical protein VFR11_15075 [Micromonosporaceae bacterium]|nr:hypothetical protein [Micromonosporaceae bacterium]